MAFSQKSICGAPCAKIEMVPIKALRPHPRNARTHSRGQLDQIEASIREFGFINPAVVDADNTIIAGHAELKRANGFRSRKSPACGSSI